MSLSDWQKAGWLVAHKADRAEIRDLLSLAGRDIRECQADGLSPDWRLAIAYNSALQSANDFHSGRVPQKAKYQRL